jgi:N-acetylglucosamine-6-sulfatase
MTWHRHRDEGVVASVIALAFFMALLQPPASQASHHQPRGTQEQPNIVLIQTDDQALSQFSSAVMPEVTKLLAAKGTQFDHAYLTTPDCCPSRAALLTGQYGHNNGVLRNAYPLLKDKRNVLPVWLSRAGYVTAHIGKFLNAYHHNGQPLAPAPGWTQWHTLVRPARYYDYDLSVNGQSVHYGNEPRAYSTRVFNRTALRLIHNYVPRRRPLYLQLDEVAPHVEQGTYLPPPQCNPIPDPRDAGMFSDTPLPQPPSFDERDASDKPSFIRALHPLSDSDLTRMTRNYRCGLAALQAVDRSVGRIYHEIKHLGELRQTVFIFYTDNGVFYGEHRIPLGKLIPYEEATSTPLVMRVPRRYLHGMRPVAHVSEPVANVDFAPTILRLAHAEPCRRAGDCRTMDGRALTPLISGRKPTWAPGRPIGLEIDLRAGTSDHPVCEYTGVRADGQVLTNYLRAKLPSSDGCVADDEWERYDLTKDPFQLQNLCFAGDYANCPQDQTQQQLERLLRRTRDCAGVSGRDPRSGQRPYCD